ncbi:MAG: HPF/RaiA family ribosome-associated protein [Dehalococcoidia bacterium]|nr:HPF/RaiA family ribosome-associated protein [Dehalococcoidia bacterium]
MDVPVKITYRGLEKTDAIENLVREKVDKLEQVHGHIISCRVVLEERHKSMQTGKPYLVRVEVAVPPGQFVIGERESTRPEREEPLSTLIRNAFEATRRQLADLAERQRHEVKIETSRQITALVEKIFREEGYGFLRTLDGRQIYFHRNSALHGEFDRLEIGTGVRFAEEMGEKGPQASSVEIVDKPGSRLRETGQAK